MNQKSLIISAVILVLLTFIAAAKIVPQKEQVLTCKTYDKFGGKELDLTKWEIRQDVEGQPFLDEYGILNENGNSAFHTKQNDFGDQRVYLFPLANFTTGESIEYDAEVVERSENSWWGNLVILTGSDYIRAGILGSSAPSELNQLGTSHISLKFENNNWRVERTSPSGELFIDNVPLSASSGNNYQLYIGTYGNDATVHIDYDNVKVCEY